MHKNIRYLLIKGRTCDIFWAKSEGGLSMNTEQIWQPVILEENREPVSHREPGEEFL